MSYLATMNLLNGIGFIVSMLTKMSGFHSAKKTLTQLNMLSFQVSKI